MTSLLSKDRSSILTRLQRKLKSLLWELKCFSSSPKIFLFTLENDISFYYPLKTLIGKALFLEAFEKQEIQIVKKFLKRGDVFIDIGANGGFYTTIASKIVGEAGHVYAFEPGMSELNLLRQNISVNNMNNVTIIEKAVSRRKGTAKFAISRDGAMNSLLENNHPSQDVETWQDVEITTIDDIIEELDIKKIDFIKIDVEGAEKLVFEGGENFFSLNFGKAIVLFEASDLTSKSFGYSTEDLLNKLIENGFFLYYIGAGSQLFPISEYHPRFGDDIYNFVGSKFELFNS